MVRESLLTGDWQSDYEEAERILLAIITTAGLTGKVRPTTFEEVSIDQNSPGAVFEIDSPTKLGDDVQLYMMLDVGELSYGCTDSTIADPNIELIADGEAIEVFCTARETIDYLIQYVKI